MEEEKDGTESDGGSKDIMGGEAPATEAKPEHTGTVAEGWLAGVGNEWAEDSSMQNIKSIEDLAKGYVHAQRMVGKDKVVLPSDLSTDDEKREFLHKMGLPKDKEEYKINRAEESKVSDDFANSFIERAYAQGIMPSQAQDMLDFYEDQVGAEEKVQAQMMEQDMTSTVEALKGEYGQAFDSKIVLANKVLSDTMDEATIEKMRASGLLNNGEFIRTMVKIGEGLVTEGKFTHDPKADGRLTPSEAKAKIGEIQGNMAHPYHNKAHPNHQVAVNEVAELFNFAG